MTGWLRLMKSWVAKVLAFLMPPARRPLPPLRSTRRELNATREHHVRRIARADDALRDWKRFDGAFRVVARPKQ